jgi:quercetin dioxygenase-like cupin family protein
MRPLWKLSELKQMHAGQNNWQEQIIRDPEQEATYNSAAPGTRFSPRIHPDTPTVFVVIAGQLRFTVEGQAPATGVRGSIVNIMKTTVYSYEAIGDQNALWVEVDPANYKVLFPAEGTTAPPADAGRSDMIRVSFGHTPPPYTGLNKLMYNTFEEAIAGCKPGVAVDDDHIWASPLLGYVNAADNKCGTGNGNIGGGAPKADDPPFDSHTIFGHMHPGPAEWWIVQVGQISGKFENMGEYHATEGDVLYAAPMSWHQMAAEAPSGPNVRLAFGGYQLINMNNTVNPGRRGGQ